MISDSDGAFESQYFLDVANEETCFVCAHLKVPG